jgi:hypothetical protein
MSVLRDLKVYACGEARTVAALQLLYPSINRFNCRFAAGLKILFVRQLSGFKCYFILGSWFSSSGNASR